MTVSAAIVVAVAVAQAQTPNIDQSQMDRTEAMPSNPHAEPPAGRGGAVGTTGDATSGAGAVRREQQPKNTPIAPGTGGGGEGQVPQMDRH
jgi:hypothetical protein